MTEQNFPLYEEAVPILKKRDKKLAWLMERIGPLAHTDLKDDFRFFIEQVIGQMLSIRVADVMIGRLADLCRGAITAGTICSPASERSPTGNFIANHVIIGRPEPYVKDENRPKGLKI